MIHHQRVVFLTDRDGVGHLAPHQRLLQIHPPSRDNPNRHTMQICTVFTHIYSPHVVLSFPEFFLSSVRCILQEAKHAGDVACHWTMKAVVGFITVDVVYYTLQYGLANETASSRTFVPCRKAEELRLFSLFHRLRSVCSFQFPCCLCSQ
jgi:hypothetical protein